MSQRIMEAEKMGFTQCILPYANIEKIEKTGNSSMKITGVRNIGEVLRFFE